MDLIPGFAIRRFVLVRTSIHVSSGQKSLWRSTQNKLIFVYNYIEKQYKNLRLRDGGQHVAAGKQKLRQTDEKSALRAPIRRPERSHAVCGASRGFDFMGRRIATRISVGHTSLRRSAQGARRPLSKHGVAK
jgi:hypothetical protein